MQALTKHKFKFLITRINIEELYLYFRRIFYWHFRRKYVLNSIAKRKGNCNCNFPETCCNYFGCKYLKDKKCTIHAKKPTNCRIFPFDEKDKPERLRTYCKFYW